MRQREGGECHQVQQGKHGAVAHLDVVLVANLRTGRSSDEGDTDGEAITDAHGANSHARTRITKTRGVGILFAIHVHDLSVCATHKEGDAHACDAEQPQLVIKAC